MAWEMPIHIFSPQEMMQPPSREGALPSLQPRASFHRAASHRLLLLLATQHLCSQSPRTTGLCHSEETLTKDSVGRQKLDRTHRPDLGPGSPLPSSAPLGSGSFLICNLDILSTWSHYLQELKRLWTRYLDYVASRKRKRLPDTLCTEFQPPIQHRRGISWALPAAQTCPPWEQAVQATLRSFSSSGWHNPGQSSYVTSAHACTSCLCPALLR